METAEYESVTCCRTSIARGLSGKEGYQCRLALQELRSSERSARSSPARNKKAEDDADHSDGRRGPGRPPGRSKFSDKTIISLTEKNPRRPGTHGHRSFEIILRAGGKIKYEDYKERGGRNNDLQWDIDHKHVEVK